MVTFDTINLLATSSITKSQCLCIFDQKLIGSHSDGFVPLIGFHDGIKVIDHDLFLAMWACDREETVVT